MRRNHYVISLHRNSAFQDQISQSTHFPSVLTEKNKDNSCSDCLETKEISLVRLPTSFHCGSNLAPPGVELLGSSVAQYLSATSLPSREALQPFPVSSLAAGSLVSAAHLGSPHLAAFPLLP